MRKLTILAALLTGCGLFTTVEAPPTDAGNTAVHDAGTDAADCDGDLCETTADAATCDPACQPPEVCLDGTCGCAEGDEACQGNCPDSRPMCKTQGVCADEGAAVCSDGEWSCDFGPNYEDREVTCDGLDNDCDGTPDNLINKTCTLGAGVCQATAPVTCEDGEEVCGAMPAVADEANETTCDDGLDTDCDGLVDCDDEDCLDEVCDDGAPPMRCHADGSCS